MSDSMSLQRQIHLTGGINFRDLGGYVGSGGRRVRWRQLFRSGTTHLLTAEDLRVLEKLKIRAVVDLRSEAERRSQPHALLGRENVEYFSHNHSRPGGNLVRMLEDPQRSPDLREAMLGLYRRLPYELLEGYRQLFSALIAGSTPLAFNCTAGKDRTGAAAALVLSALGVSWDDIADDYLLTAQCVPQIMAMYGSKRPNIIERFGSVLVAPIFGVERAYLEAMRDAIVERSGSIEDYFKSELGLGARELAELQRQLTDVN